MTHLATITGIIAGLQPGERSVHAHMGGSFVVDRMFDGRVVVIDTATDRRTAFKSAAGAARRIVRGNRRRCSNVRLNCNLTTTECRRVEGHSGDCRFSR